MLRKLKVLLFIPLLFVATACCDRGAEMAKYTIHFDLRKAVKMNLPEFVDSIFVIPLATNDSSLIKNVVGLSFVDSIFYINDNQTNILSFDSKGNFLCSTGKLRGSGPNEYFACIAFNILENGNCEIFDGLKHRLWEYDSNLNYVASSELPEDVLPASNFLRVSKDICIIEDVNSLKFYSSKEGRVLKMISLPQKKGLPSITRNSGLKKLNDEIYYSLRTPERILFKVDIEKMSLQPYYAFDFGQHNLNLRELPNELPLSFYQNYVMANDGVAFVADKLVSSTMQMCFFIYNKKMYFAIHNKNNGFYGIYYNEAKSFHQLMIPNLYLNDMLYYICEPRALDYVLDFKLMSSEDINKIQSIREDDNPVVVCYKLKR